MLRRYKIAIGAGATAVALAVGGFGPFVRSRVAAAASRYGAVVQVGQVVPMWRGVRLRDVRISFEEVPSADVRLSTIEVTSLGDGRHLVLKGGEVALQGPRQSVLDQVGAWRARRLEASTAGSESEGGEGRTRVENVTVKWRDSVDSDSLELEGLGVVRRAGAVVIDARRAESRFGSTELKATEVHVEVVRDGERRRLRELRAADLGVSVRLAEGRPLDSGKSETPGAPSSKGLATVERARQLRMHSLRAASLIDEVLAPGAGIAFSSVRAKVRVGEDELNLGPGELTIGRANGGLLIELKPSGAGGFGGEEALRAGPERTLTFRASIPIGAGKIGDPGELVADVRGGPIGLATLGVSEGDFGLFDVAETSLETNSHVVLSADGRRVVVAGEGKLHKLSLKSAGLAALPVKGLELAWRGKGEAELDGSALRVDEGEVDVGAVRVDASGNYARAGSSERVRAVFEVPLTACQSMLDALPTGLVPRLAGMKMAGSFAIKGQAGFDTEHLDRDFSMPWEVSNSCRVIDVSSAIGVEQFRRPFRHTIYDGEGRPLEVEMGPGTPDWTPYSSISKFMEVALLTTEDGGFFRHRGFDEEAIRNSIRENLKRGRFVRGASTLSMQLAKNLYLGRGKTLSRKLQEAVLTMYLEQELTKEQILELYLNIVEFGPMLYGIGPASRHYFGVSPSGLSLAQALYISSILPSPKKQHFGAGGRVTPGYMGYLRKLMVLANKRHRITDEELEQGLAETLVFGRSAPTSPGEGAGAGSHDGAEPDEPTDDNGGWQVF